MVPSKNILNGNGNGTIQNTSFHTSSITGDTLNHGFLQDLAGLGEPSSENLYQYQNYGEMNGMNGINGMNTQEGAARK